jgi:hypothetical protein
MVNSGKGSKIEFEVARFLRVENNMASSIFGEITRNFRAIPQILCEQIFPKLFANNIMNSVSFCTKRISKQSLCQPNLNFGGNAHFFQCIYINNRDNINFLADMRGGSIWGLFSAIDFLKRFYLRAF